MGFDSGRDVLVRGYSATGNCEEKMVDFGVERGDWVGGLTEFAGGWGVAGSGMHGEG